MDIAFQDIAFQHFYDDYVLHPNKTNTDGLKRKVLKPYDSSDSTTTFANQVTTQSTVYIIRYNYNLGGQTFTIPYNSLLIFDGGSINNGTVIFTSFRLSFTSSYTIVGPTSYLSSLNSFYDCYVVSSTSTLCNLYSQNSIDDLTVKFWIHSDRVTPITLEANTNASGKFSSCKFVKNANAVRFVNRTNNTTNIIFEDCEVSATTFTRPTDTNSVITVEDGRTIIDFDNPPTPYPRPTVCNVTLKCRNCLFDNVGLSGHMDLENCVFKVGSNNLFGNEVAHLYRDSVVKSCLFYSPDGFTPTVPTDSQGNPYSYDDILDCYTGGNVLIQHCIFKNIKCNTYITVKQHFGRGDGRSQGFYDPADNYPIIPMDSVTITDCVFDCKEFDIKDENTKVSLAPMFIMCWTGAGITTTLNDYRVVGPINICRNIFYTKECTCIYVQDVRDISIKENIINLKDGYYNAKGFQIRSAYHIEVVDNKEYLMDLSDTETHNLVYMESAKECIIARNIGRNAYITMPPSPDYLYFCDNVSNLVNMLNTLSPTTFNSGNIESHGNKAGAYFQGYMSSSGDALWQAINPRFLGASVYYAPTRQEAHWDGSGWVFPDGTYIS